MNRTKLLYAEDIRNNLYSGLIQRDVKIDFREIFLAMDRAVNFFAKAGFFENWKLGFGGSVDDLWITSFDNLTITDVANQNSYFTLPSSNYVNLPAGQGINEIYFMNDPTKVTKKYFKPVIIKNWRDVSGYRSSMAGDNQGRISCAIKNRVIYFDRGKVGQQYGKCGVRLVLRDASALSDTDVYPIPADAEEQFLKKSIDFFMERRIKEPDLVRDENDKQPGK